MLRIAMNEPIMAASTAIQVAVLARFGSTLTMPELKGRGRGADRTPFDMTRPSQNVCDALDVAATRSRACDLVSMVGITDMPGRNSIEASLSRSSAILTG